ncbi:radical SAM protein [Candidatus Bathyarchaeota archaeon]|nr:radical SAM protein [Candidatus Bathyarchaeota archaeon]
MRICLINPPRIHPKSWGKPSVSQPIELAYSAAVLEKQHEVMLLDVPGEGWRELHELDSKRWWIGLKNEEITHRIKAWSPDIVGINVPFSGWSETAFETASLIKEIDPEIITVMDGVHPTARPAECLSHKAVDFVIIGEAEQTWLELADAIEKGYSLSELKKIRGIGFKKNGEALITPSRPFIQDLDALPFPARHLLPMKVYFEAVRKNPLRGEVKKPWTMMITSRGCPHSCIFCTAHIMRGRRWRERSPENVVAEIEHVVETYGVRQIDFHDDNMTLDRERMAKLCDLIMERGLDIEWFTPNGVRADTLDRELLLKMRRSGCKRIYVAPESGVQRVVNKIIKKNLDLKAVERAVALSREVGIKVACFFVIGFIGETKEDIEATINFARRLKQLGADKFYFSYATPVYGTELYELAKAGGYLVKDFDDKALSSVEPLIETPEFTVEELRELCIRANSINSEFSLEKLKKALNNPRQALSFLFSKLARKMQNT